MDDSFSTVMKHIKQQAVTKVFHAQEWNSHQNSLKLLDLYDKDTVDINTVALLGEKIKGQWQKFGTEWPTVVWKASQGHSLFQLAKNQWTYCRFGLKK
jgi:hypothetical protein